ncbi:MAG: type II secretion system GspH family protein [Proteobacteria bacterium]|nr:prepilin-type N-terminal cleavage/methylation domain-containing protein [Desulfobulbaceae bacterium]MBU4153791.1 type II secretion system GspH family protein [Pseudomonadota bacterium]
MTSQPSLKHLNNQKGFTLIEIIAVLVLLGILAAVAVPKYMDLTTTAREKAAMGQIAEVKGRLSSGLNGYMLKNNGAKPADAATLITYVNTVTANACPTTATTEGDFEFSCSSSGTTVTITVSKVQTVAITANNTGTYAF